MDTDTLWMERASRYERFLSVFRGTKWLKLHVHRRLMRTDREWRRNFGLACNLRGYKAVAAGTNKTKWMHASDRDADSELVSDLPKLRSRSRATTRDDPIGSGIVGTLVRKVVGTGIRSQVRIPNQPEKNDVIEMVEWELLQKIDRANALDYAGHQRLIYQRTLEDGDVLLRAVISKPGDPVWVEVIEADRLKTPVDAEPVDPRGRIVAGVEKDGAGIPVAYWVSHRHPGDSMWSNETRLGRDAARVVAPLSKQDFDRVPADQCQLVRARVTRPGQTRGVVIFHSILQDLHDLDLLILASLKRSQVAACLAMFITSAGDSTDILELTAEEYGYKLDQDIEPAMMFRLFPGEKAEFLNPTAGAPNLDEFVLVLARRIGAAVGLSPQSVLRFWDNVSYAGARTIKTDEYQTVRLERSSFISQALCWERYVVMVDALQRGEPELMRAGVTLQDLHDKYVEHIGDEEDWVDPQAEAAATKIKLEIGLSSLQIECARLGRDWRDVIRQRLEVDRFEAAEREKLAQMDREAAGAPDTENVQDTALNGAQLAALQQVMLAVSSQQLPAVAAIEMLALAFPTLGRPQIEKMVQAAAAHTPPAPPKPAAPPKAAPPEKVAA